MLAQSGPSVMSAVRSLSGEYRTWRGQPNSVESALHPLAEVRAGRGVASTAPSGRLLWQTATPELRRTPMADHEVEPATSTIGKVNWGKIAAYVAGGIVCVLALPSPRASMNSGDQGNPGSGTRYSSSAKWNNVAPTLLFRSTAGRVTSPAQVAQVVLRARWWQLPSRS